MSVPHLDGLGSGWARVRVAAALLAGAGRADAQSRAVGAAPLSVWYRSSEGGPERGVFGVGVQGSLVNGVAPSWAVGGAAFVERRARQDLAPSMRLSLGAALATDTVAALDVDVLWLAGRVEGCVFELRSGDLLLQPCAGLELGVLRARSPGDEVRTDNGFWGAGVGVLRASLELTKRFALEAQLGAAVPFVRYTVGSSLGGDLYRTEPVSLALAIGGRWEP